MNDGRPVVVVGCGDHSRVIRDVLQACGTQVLGCVEPHHRSASGLDVPPIGDLDDPQEWIRQRPNFVVAIGSNQARADAFGRCVALGLEPIAAIHPSAVILGGARIEPGAQICAGAIVGVDAHVMANAIVNTAASVDHDNEIGEHAFIAPGARLAGRVIVGPGAHVGLGAAVREGTTIGEWSLVAAGAVVVRSVLARQRVAGVPAEPMRAPRDDARGKP
jgi:sugar O-acyltransferase (sialic acid O-acetyltransferase NeuD family)